MHFIDAYCIALGLEFMNYINFALQSVLPKISHHSRPGGHFPPTIINRRQGGTERDQTLVREIRVNFLDFDNEITAHKIRSGRHAHAILTTTKQRLLAMRK